VTTTSTTPTTINTATPQIGTKRYPSFVASALGLGAMSSRKSTVTTQNGRGAADKRDAQRDAPREQLSTGLWLLKHTQGIVTTATALGILHLRTSHVLYFTIGSLATSFTAKGLKRVIKQPRPPGSRVKKTSGMPSTHSATISFMGTYIMLSSLLLPLHPSLILDRTSTQSDQMVRIWLALIGVAAPVLVMWSRVRLGVHTRAQTLVGAALGVVKAIVWFTLWNGTQIMTGTSSAPVLDAATFPSTLQVGLRATVGTRIDSLIRHTEATLRDASGF
jgi:dolichyldiphosphatase